MKTKTLTKSDRRKIIALSSIVGIMIGIGITVAAGGTLFYTFQSQTDPFTTSSSLEVRNLNAVLDDDTLRLTATVKNSGQTSITEVYIDSITVSDLTIKQNSVGILNVDGDGGDKNFCTVAVTAVAANNVIACTKADDARGFSLSENADEDAADADELESTLEGGRTNALVMEIESSSAPDLSDDVNISDKLNLVLRFTSGQDELLTDVFTTRVKPG